VIKYIYSIYVKNKTIKHNTTMEEIVMTKSELLCLIIGIIVWGIICILNTYALMLFDIRHNNSKKETEDE